MKTTNVRSNALPCFAMLFAFAAAVPASPQSGGTTYTYTKMAPTEQYLMADRDAEIALARSAAPDSIASDAEVQVLGRRGFETAAKGRNGFVCMVGRSWTSGPDVWNPKVRVPMCFNAAGARSYLARVNKETGWILAGRTLAQVDAAIPAAVASKELPPMEPGAMCYMMSKLGFGGEGVPHWPSHLMFFYSDTDAAMWGANLPGSPVIAVADPEERLTQFVIAVPRWADGTSSEEAFDAEHHHH